MTSPEPQSEFGENLSQTSDESPFKQRRWLRLSLAFILITGGVTAIVWRGLTPTNQVSLTNIKTPGVRVKVSPVQIGTVEESSDFVASLESQRSVQIPSKIPGQVTQIFLQSGDPVTAGTAIIEVDSKQATIDEMNAARQAAVAQRENTRVKLQSLEAARQSHVADLQLQQQDYDRYAELANQGAVSRRARDEYASKLATAKANLGAINAQIQAEQATISQAETALQQAEANIQNQQVQPKNYRITAPFSGTVGDIPVKVGDLVNTSTPLVTVSQKQPLQVNISVPQEQSKQLRQGMPVEVLNPQGQVISTSKISLIAPDTNNEKQSSLVKALFNNSQGELKPDQLVRARVIWNQRSGVLVPTKAVSRLGGETFVYVIKREESSQGVSQLIARQKSVKLGNIRDDNYQVLAGLQPEDQIITSGLLNVKDGVAIVPES
ncbi:efflux RND transporter periplasmic adaptor subunit [Nodularia sphaerocarpa]|uniref:efflux RND transporter periplasmic adaptor subunit n=1 Tax=Nodularia sphaerocarpa TaxID=137816 RepID=UPI001EFB79E3|nr:efflux RND transporter periplasmic adaptor subunit [Nodularia sphaerocarpa]MDB9374922.1 efflux RND transporter periplasmic adaptor subunit [Nodularia sphaerocarpa CS-585]MDB9378556.1 efflux RND transporter periplasmic adaptor subunit [Nodularia sphaerocarpa CS-585A2]ULP72726.1 Multidrug resistance protein MdtA [Nodularia sphaerocarpa UHCC 0038]